MKNRISFFVLIILTCLSSVTAQSTPRDSFSFLGNSFDHDWVSGTFKISSEGLVGSNAINTTMYSDILYRSAFTPKAKQQFLDGTQNRLKTYSFLQSNAAYKINEKIGVFLKHKMQIGLSANKEFSELLFFGNASFQNQEVASENNSFIQSSAFSAGLSILHAKNERWFTKASYGISAVTDYKQITADKLAVFTANGGSYLDATVEHLSITENNDGLQGIGLDIDFETEYSIDSKNKILFKALDLNVNYLLDKSQINIDTALHFQGASYRPFSDTVSLATKLDSTYNGFIARNRSSKKWISLPSRLSLQWQMVLSPKALVLASVETIDLGKLGTSGAVGIDYTFNDKLRILSSIGYGTFSGVKWREAVEYKVSDYSIYLNLIGLNSLIVPRHSKNYGVGLGFAKRL